VNGAILNTSKVVKPIQVLPMKNAKERKKKSINATKSKIRNHTTKGL
jgi:hypothetical protein